MTTDQPVNWSKIAANELKMDAHGVDDADDDAEDAKHHADACVRHLILVSPYVH